MFWTFPHITLIIQPFELIDNLWKILHTDISNGIPWIFLFLWRSNGIDIQTGNQPLSLYHQKSFWLWRRDFYLVQTTKFQRDAQVDVLLAILYLPMFPNITTTTIFHGHRCELTKCEIFLPERLMSGSTMINRQWCYTFWEILVQNICITKWWALRSYFLYLHSFLLTLFPSITVQF